MYIKKDRLTFPIHKDIFKICFLQFNMEFENYKGICFFKSQIMASISIDNASVILRKIGHFDMGLATLFCQEINSVFGMFMKS